MANEATGGQRIKAVLGFTPPSEAIGHWTFPLVAQYFQAMF
jgi:hypothetical protein